MKQLDARGLSCPEPVLLTLEALKEAPQEPLQVLVGSTTSRVNVCDAVKRKGHQTSVERDGDDYVITIS